MKEKRKRKTIGNIKIHREYKKSTKKKDKSTKIKR